MVRKPVVSGTFYESDKEALIEQIKACFTSEFGPGKISKEIKEKSIIGLVSPHAGYLYSGPCAAHGFNKIAECKDMNTFILLGLSHSGSSSCISLDDWETPLGIAKNHQMLSNLIKEKTNLPINEQVHQNEHSIEVQIPFLQYIKKDNFKITPIIISNEIDQKIISKGIVESIKETKENAAIIASSDFTHYGMHYGYFPFQDNIKENLYGLDNKAIQYILDLDDTGFIDYIKETGATICGKLPIKALINLFKYQNVANKELLKYYTSGDIVNDYNSAVGYASIIIE